MGYNTRGGGGGVDYDSVNVLEMNRWFLFREHLGGFGIIRFVCITVSSQNLALIQSQI